MVSSTDGFCTLMTFEEGELGEPYRQRPLQVTATEVVETKGKQQAMNAVITPPMVGRFTLVHYLSRPSSILHELSS